MLQELIGSKMSEDGVLWNLPGSVTLVEEIQEASVEEVALEAGPGSEVCRGEVRLGERRLVR